MMKLMRISMMLTTSVVVASCVSRPFQPAPSDFERWRRKDASKEEVKRTMTKCRFSNHFNNGAMSAEDYAEAQNCMLREGFSHDYERGVLCDQKEYKHLRACTASGMKGMPTTIR
jgi:hypothetical protein